MDDHLVDLEIKLAYQEKLIHDLDALVRQFGDKLDEAMREIRELKAALRSPAPSTGPANEPPPHY